MTNTRCSSTNVTAAMRVRHYPDGVEPGGHRILTSAPGHDDETFPGIITAQAYDVSSTAKPALDRLTAVEENRLTGKDQSNGLLSVGSDPVRSRRAMRRPLPAPGMVAHRAADDAGDMVHARFRGPLPEDRYAAAWDGKKNGGRRVTQSTYYYHLGTSCGRSIQTGVLTAR